MSIRLNGTAMSLPQYRALQIHEFLERKYRPGIHLEADYMLHLIAGLLPGDGITQTTLVTHGMRHDAMYRNDLCTAVRSLLEAYVASEPYKRLTHGVMDLMGKLGPTAEVVKGES